MQMRTLSMASFSQHGAIPMVRSWPEYDVLPARIVIEIGEAQLNFDLATAERLAADIMREIVAARAETPEVAA